MYLCISFATIAAKVEHLPSHRYGGCGRRHTEAYDHTCSEGAFRARRCQLEMMKGKRSAFFAPIPVCVSAHNISAIIVISKMVHDSLLWILSLVATNEPLRILISHHHSMTVVRRSLTVHLYGKCLATCDLRLEIACVFAQLRNWNQCQWYSTFKANPVCWYVSRDNRHADEYIFSLAFNSVENSDTDNFHIHFLFDRMHSGTQLTRYPLIQNICKSSRYNSSSSSPHSFSWSIPLISLSFGCRSVVNILAIHNSQLCKRLQSAGSYDFFYPLSRPSEPASHLASRQPNNWARSRDTCAHVFYTVECT